jgi:DNA polymerase III epsilon subunit-like protein
MTDGYAPVVFLDCETTGLYPALGHEPWEIACIWQDDEKWKETLFYPEVDLSIADPNALRLTSYYSRRASESWYVESRASAAESVAEITAGKYIVGAVPSFDAGMLDPWLRRNGQCLSWHYHLICCEALAAGLLGQEPPWNSDDLSRNLGVEPTDRHTALGDARWAKAMYEAVMAAKR